jgi:ParB-like chromosome segregation protein Spo0J
VKIEVRKVSIDKLKEAEYNPRVQLRPGDAEYEALRKSIEENGPVVPIVWNERTGVVIGGHQRLAVLRDMGAKEVDAAVVNFTESEEKQANIALNKIEGEWDDAKLQEMFAGMDTEDIYDAGFTDAEIFATAEKAEDDGDEWGDITEPGRTEEEPEEEREEEFVVYLSFKSEESANEWVRNEGLEPNFARGRVMNVRMWEEER